MTRLLLPLVALLFPLLLPSTGWTAPNTLSDAEAINISGRQRMLSQRMMKNYLLIGAQVQADKAQRQLDQAVALFEEQLLELHDYTPSDTIDAKLEVVERLWLPHRLRIISPPTKVGIANLMQDNLTLLAACDDLVKAIETHAGTHGARLVNISGRQRMLSQKIAKVYIARYWKVRGDALDQEFADAISLFDQSLRELESYAGNSDILQSSLQRVRNQWDFSRTGFSLEDNGRFVPTVISVTTDSILAKMDAITHLYQQLMQAQHTQNPH